MNVREVLTVCHVYSMVPPHSCWSLVKLSMYVVYYVVRFHFGPNSVSNSVIVMLYASTSFTLVLTRGGYTRNVNINAYPALAPRHSDIRMCTGGPTIANLLK